MTATVPPETAVERTMPLDLPDLARWSTPADDTVVDAGPDRLVITDPDGAELQVTARSSQWRVCAGHGQRQVTVDLSEPALRALAGWALARLGLGEITAVTDSEAVL